MNRLPNLILFVFFALFVVSCETEDERPPNFEDLDVLTGINLTDFNGAPIGTWNQPNDKPGSTCIFPSPFSGTLSIFSENDIQNIWIVRATCISDDLNENIPDLSQSLSFEKEEIEALSIKSFPLVQFNNNILALNLEELTQGFYKIFYEDASGNIFWINTYNFNTYPDPSEIISSLDEMCQ